MAQPIGKNDKYLYIAYVCKYLYYFHFAFSRPKDVDKAILRRMPATFHVGLPDVHQRKSILKRILEMESISPEIDYVRLSKLTEGYSGSDLREVCRTASVYRMKELMALKAKNEAEDVKTLRHITNEDMLKAVAKLKESKVHCGTQQYATPIDLD